MQSFVTILGWIIDIVFFMVIVQLVIGLLIQFDVINRNHPLPMRIYRGIDQVLSPVLEPIRRVLPPVAGIDFSPLVLLFGLSALQVILLNNLI
ncbi:MAG: YggT family protein [Pseudomonadota bacterium]